MHPLALQEEGLTKGATTPPTALWIAPHKAAPKCDLGHYSIVCTPFALFNGPYDNNPNFGEEWRCFQAGNAGPTIWKCIGKLVKDGKYLVPRVILKEVKDHLHELFYVGTQGVDKMLAILKAWVTSLSYQTPTKATRSTVCTAMPTNLAMRRELTGIDKNIANCADIPQFL